MKKTIIYTAALIVVALLGAGLYSGYQENTQTNKSKHSPKTMVTLGDSLTYGVGDKSGEGYVENLEKLIQEEKEINVKLKNYGIPGQESDGVVKQVKLTNIQKDIRNADYIILFIGTNDLIQSNGGDLKGINEEKIKKGAVEYEKNIQDIVKTIRQENQDVPILFLGLYNSYPDSAEHESIIDEWNTNSQRLVNDYERIKFISTNDLFNEKSKKYFSDSLHPNEKGYDLITKKIIDEYDF
jgi:lysophospholipase L1-like esterase